jgi:hypothetical protein
MRLSLTVHAHPAGPLIADWSPVARRVSFSTGPHGFERCSGFVPMPLHESFSWYDRAGMPHLVVTAHGGVVWEGRLEDVAIVPGGIEFSAFGYWRAYTDLVYTSFWSSTAMHQFRQVNSDEVAGYTPHRYEFDTNNRVYIAPVKDTNYTGGTHFGALAWRVPDRSRRDIDTVSFFYLLDLPADWVAELYGYDENFTGAELLWQEISSGSVISGSAAASFMYAKPILVARLFYNGASPTTYSGETGDSYFRLTAVEMRSQAAPIYADHIAADLVDYAYALNGSRRQVIDDKSLISAPGVALKDEVYEDRYPYTILDQLAAIGDSSTPPRRYEVGVFEGRRLHFRPRGAAGRAWHVDAGALEVERTLDPVINAAYTTYRDSRLFPLRTDTLIDNRARDRFGVLRLGAVEATTTSQLQAEIQRDAHVTDWSNPPPRSSLSCSRLFDAWGAAVPLWGPRSGDTVTIRNLPPTVSPGIDSIRTFRIARTEYDIDADRLTIEPEVPPPTLPVIVAQRKEAVR